MHKSSSFNGLLNGEGLQGRWQTSFIRRKSKFRFHFVYLLATVLIFLIVCIVSLPSTKKSFSGSYSVELTSPVCASIVNYNNQYPLTNPIVNPHLKSTVYRIAIIADLDRNSNRDKSQSSYSSFFKRGHLAVGQSQSTFEFKWDQEDSETEISSGYALKGTYKNNKF